MSEAIERKGVDPTLADCLLRLRVSSKMQRDTLPQKTSVFADGLSPGDMNEEHMGDLLLQ